MSSRSTSHRPSPPLPFVLNADAYIVQCLHDCWPDPAQGAIAFMRGSGVFEYGRQALPGRERSPRRIQNAGRVTRLAFSRRFIAGLAAQGDAR